MEKGFRVNSCNPEVRKCDARFGPTEDVGKWPCGVYRKGDG